MRSAFYIRITVMAALFCVWPMTVVAQSGDEDGAPETQEPESTESADGDAAEASEARAFYDQAVAAFDAGEYQKALFELDRAWRLDKNLVYLYQRILVLEAMGREEMALELLEENRDGLLETTGVNDLFVVEERLRTAVKETDTVEDPNVSEEDKTPTTSRSALNWIGPITLGVAGIGLSIWGATFFSDECVLEGTSGCLKTEKAQTGTGIALVGAGVASIAAGVVWFILTSPSDDAAAARSEGVRFTGDGFAITF